MKNFKFIWVLVLFCAVCLANTAPLDESVAVPGQWGYRPFDGQKAETNPPSFCWRPMKGMQWQLQCASDELFNNIEYEISNWQFNVHCPAKVFKPGKFYWRYRGTDSKGNITNWSVARSFIINPTAVEFPMPTKSELLSKIPKQHPRLFVRPENIPALQAAAKGNLNKQYKELAKQCEKLLKNPPSTQEPPKYTKNEPSGSDPWRKVWWGNRDYTIRVLNAAATLGFTYQLDGNKKFGNEAKRLLLECARWDPKGSTGYRYNDEAGMPYAYYFARAYTFVNALLDEKEKNICRDMMKIRGTEMYNHLCPRHLWQPYASHSNRAWHFLGEVGIAFYDEIPDAKDWVYFAMNVFYNVYPVWSDSDGGWHEGQNYWVSYVGRFTWWIDVMKQAMGIDAYKKPYFSKIGDYPIYLSPPNKVGGGFGDLNGNYRSSRNRELMTALVNQSGNGYWQDYLDKIGGPSSSGGYIGFMREGNKKVQAKPLAELPTSKLFKGIGQAYLNSTLEDANKGIQITFKSSPFGTQSHGYEANNSFLLGGYGKQLLIRSGRRDQYGSVHHAKWMWSTRSTNCITVNDYQGQGRRSSKAQGEIVAFMTSDDVDIVAGQGSQAYEQPLENFLRTIIFIKPDIMIVYDCLETREPSTYQYWLHGLEKFDIKDQHNIKLKNDNVSCNINFVWPENLKFQQSDKCDPQPRERVKLNQWHLQAKIDNKQKQVEYIAVYKINKDGHSAKTDSKVKRIQNGYELKIKSGDKEIKAILPIASNKAELETLEVITTKDNKTFTTRLSDKPQLKTSDICIRDPFIYADTETETYYMYAQIGNRLGNSNEKGVEVYRSNDLENWQQPQPVLLLEQDCWARKMVWAPEMHKYKGKYYLFVTLTSDDLHTHIKKPEGVKSWPPFYKRGTQIFVADSPLGPFTPFANKPHTPENWMALDGTLYVEDGKAYMIFCHEWVEVCDGSVDIVRLRDDLSDTIGQPQKLFSASQAKWVNRSLDKVTDGPYLYKTSNSKLLMIWSSFGGSSYKIGIARSKTGNIKGPWTQDEKLLFEAHGGHGMILNTFDGQLVLALHQPNSPNGQERLKLFKLKDTGDSIEINGDL
ncbi:MAG: DUF4962 domain-containing protein [Phycisphaerae bacterium]|nr:DUF4962 domain-containing protein [Phycisphaerae bacterium]